MAEDVVTTDSTTKSPSDRGIHSLIALGASSLVHTVAILSVAMVLIHKGSVVGPAVVVSMVAQDTSEEMTEFEVSLGSVADSPASAEEPNVSIDLQNQLSEIGPLKSEGDAPSLGGSSSYAGAGVNDQFAEAAGHGRARRSIENELTSKSRASFFGAEAYGNKFVFVIDSSGSMRGPRWQALCKELIRAIENLSPDQQFFIISFDSMAHPMFNKAPPYGKFLTPTGKNIERVQNWIRSIEHGRQTYPSSAVGIAMQLGPDAIFLLSDGEINDSTVNDLRIWNRITNDEGEEKAKVPIHTVLLHSNAGFATLEAIAKENGGTFTPVEP